MSITADTVSWGPGKALPEHKPVEAVMAEHALRKYHGAVATGYDAKREESPKWHAEQAIITDMLSDIPSGDWILDCPVGTGRFIPVYEERGFCVQAVDVSVDMMKEAIAKVTKPGNWINFTQADIRTINLWPQSVDVSLMVRLTRWLSPDDCIVALRQLQRVTRKRIIFTARVRHRRPDLVRGYDMINAALEGWDIARDEQTGDDPDLRVIALEPAA